MEERIDAQKMVIGETIDYDRVIKKYVETEQYGTQVIAMFSKNGKVIRKVFASDSLLKFIDENKKAKKVTLVDRVSDGKFTYNIYE